MKGIIKISTPVVEHQLPLMAFNETEILFKCKALKEKIKPGRKIPYVIWLQVPSRMNAADFK